MPDFRGGPFFIKKLKFQNFGRPPGLPPWPAPQACPPGLPCLPALFSRAVGRKSKISSQRFVRLVVLFPKRYDTTPVPQSPQRRKIWKKNPFFGVWAWPREPRGPNSLSKNYLQGVHPENLTTIWPLSQKLFHIVAVTDGQTDRHTFWIPLDP